MKRLIVLLLVTFGLFAAPGMTAAQGTGVMACVALPAPLSHAVVIEWDWNRPRHPIKSQGTISDPTILYALMNLTGRVIWIGGTVQTWERPPEDMFRLSTYEVHLIPAGYADNDSSHYAIVKIFDNDLNWNESYVLAFAAGIPAQHPCFAAGVDKGGLYWILSQAQRR
jgi:hypothetical protein